MTNNANRFLTSKKKWDAFVKAYTGPYDFSKSVYMGMNNKVRYVCPTHGQMQSDAKVLMRGGMCQKCMFSARKGKYRMTQKKMLERFLSVHADTYDYSKAVYRGQTTPIIIICREHGEFKQKPGYHWDGAGCYKCFNLNRRGASQRDTLETLRQKVTKVFAGRIKIVSDTYVNSQTNIEVTCAIHGGVLPARPNSLTTGYNPCPRCNHMKSSQEDVIAKFLAIFTPVVQRDRTLIKPRELDIYLPQEQLAVEYCGMFWHSHGDKESEQANRLRHFKKHEDCAAAGVRLITVYESEWQANPRAIKRLLRNAIGKSKGRLGARKCELREVPSADARAFYDKYHPQGGAGHGEHYGLYWKGKLVACMRFVYGANDRGPAAANRVWTLGRYATRVNVAGAASRLFKAFLTKHNPTTVKSFSDNRYFEGGMYRQLGFQIEEEIAPDYQVWSPKIGLRPKSHYQRRKLPARLAEHDIDPASFDPATDPRAESEITYLMGARRIYDCGKRRWVWTC